MTFRWLALCILWVPCSIADVPVTIPDTLLKRAIEDELWLVDPTPADMAGLVSLARVGTFETQTSGVQELTGLEHAVNLQRLNLRLNAIDDLTPLAGLSWLKELDLSRNQLSDLSPLSGLVGLTHLNVHGNQIRDLAPLSSLTNLTFLDLHRNNLTHLDDLSGLVNLSTLILYRNSISDISGISSLLKLEGLMLSSNQVGSLEALASLQNLKELNLYSNHVEDVSILSGLTGLVSLDLSHNWISDISPLTGLKNLTSLDLSLLNLNDDAYAYELVELAESVADLVYTSNTNPPSQFKATQGDLSHRVDIQWSPIPNGPFYTSYYRVLRACSENEPLAPISPWLTTTRFSDTTALPGQEYVYDLQIATNPQGLNHRSLFVSTRGWPADTPRLYVDVNADTAGEADGSVMLPFRSLQTAIDAAIPGTTIVARPGVYREQLLFRGKAVVVTGIPPCASATMATFPVIEPMAEEPAIAFTEHEDANSVLAGFVVRCGSDPLASAIYCNNSSPTIRNCLVVGNRHREAAALQGTVVCIDSQARFVNCTIADNLGYGLYLDKSPVSLVNSILWQNSPEDIHSTNSSHPTVLYCNLNSPSFSDTNLHMEPGFVRSGDWKAGVWVPGDYHLVSQAGHWDSSTEQWIHDAVTSPLIDQGDPNTPVNSEPYPYGSRVNLGTYGGTFQASKSAATVE